jgi:hypothetical protein
MKFANKTIVFDILVRQLAKLPLAKTGIGDKILPLTKYVVSQYVRGASLSGRTLSQAGLLSRAAASNSCRKNIGPVETVFGQHPIPHGSRKAGYSSSSSSSSSILKVKGEFSKIIPSNTYDDRFVLT